MKYVIFNKESTRLAGDRYGYKSERAAKGQLTKLFNAGKLEGAKEDYDITDDIHFYEAVEKSVERTNAMTGEKFMEPINTPYYCSPSSETYWSM